MLGQVPTFPTTAQQFADLISIQFLLNELLRSAGQSPVRTDGVLDSETCSQLLALSRQEFGQLSQLDQQLVDLINQYLPQLDAACRALRAPGAAQPPEQPPAQQVPAQQVPPAQVPAFVPDPCEPVDLGEQSERVRDVQRQINAQLRNAGYVTISENGVWDPITCRAIGFLTFGIDPPRPPAEWLRTACPGGIVFELNCPPAPAPVRAGAPAPAAAGAGISGGLVALLAAAALAGLYLVTRS
jgi:hypothetical protein